MTRSGTPIIGIAGGIGSGKSTVASIFAKLGACVVDSDRLSHEELDTPDVLAALRQWWGDRVIAVGGGADRDAIRRIVRADPAAFRQLEGLVHPMIAKRTEALIAAWRADPQVLAIVWDAPLLFEMGLDQRCDVVVFVEASLATRLGRLTQDRGWTGEDLKELEKSQKSLDFKKHRADYIINNNSDRESLGPRVREIFSRILSGT